MILLRGLVVLLAAAAAFPMFANTITVDPSGAGFIGSHPNAGSIGNDSGPGGLNGVLVYNLPFSGMQGDLFLTFADYDNVPLDVIRFNGNGTLIFYQANVDGGPNLPGNSPSPPGALYGNVLELDRTTPHNTSLIVYAPVVGQPGYDGSNPTYDIYTYTATPEPSTAMLLFVTGTFVAGFLTIRSIGQAVLSSGATTLP